MHLKISKLLHSAQWNYDEQFGHWRESQLFSLQDHLQFSVCTGRSQSANAFLCNQQVADIFDDIGTTNIIYVRHDCSVWSLHAMHLSGGAAHLRGSVTTWHWLVWHRPLQCCADWNKACNLENVIAGRFGGHRDLYRCHAYHPVPGWREVKLFCPTMDVVGARIIDPARCN